MRFVSKHAHSPTDTHMNSTPKKKNKKHTLRKSSSIPCVESLTCNLKLFVSPVYFTASKLNQKDLKLFKKNKKKEQEAVLLQAPNLAKEENKNTELKRLCFRENRQRRRVKSKYCYQRRFRKVCAGEGEGGRGRGTQMTIM